MASDAVLALDKAEEMEDELSDLAGSLYCWDLWCLDMVERECARKGYVVLLEGEYS